MGTMILMRSVRVNTLMLVVDVVVRGGMGGPIDALLWGEALGVVVWDGSGGFAAAGFAGEK
jgi:hypothetical protein